LAKLIESEANKAICQIEEEEMDAEFIESETPLFSQASHTKGFRICVRWIEKFTKPRATINRKYSLEMLRQSAENWYDEYPVTKEDFIMAANKCGYTSQSVKGSSDCYFNMGFEKGTPFSQKIN
jgi:hypothetical protein